MRSASLIGIPIIAVASLALGSLISGPQEAFGLILGLVLTTTATVLLVLNVPLARMSVDYTRSGRTAGVTTEPLDALPAALLAKLSSRNDSDKVRALYELEALAQSSKLGARLAIPAIEDLIRNAVPTVTSFDSMVKRRTSSQARPEVQIGLIILGTIPHELRGATRFRLSRLDLRGYSFEGLDMSAASFEYSILDRCVLVKGLFDGADFRDASLVQIVGESASFRRALLERVSFVGAFLTDTNFEGALVLEADFSEAILAAANFDSAVIVESNFEQAHYKGSELDDSGELVLKEGETFSMGRDTETRDSLEG